MRRPRGFSLLELQVALALSLTLLAAFFGVVRQSSSLFAANDSLAQTQDAARHALAVLVSDIEHAGFFGFAPATFVELVRNGVVLATEEELRQPTPEFTTAPAPGLPDGAHDCGVNFAVDLLRPVQGTDGTWPAADDCDPTESAGGARKGADTLVLRHASLAVTEPRAGRLQVHSRAASSQPLRIFADGRVPTPGDVTDEEAGDVRDLEVRLYYVANQSVGNATLPALRVKALTESRGRAQFRDEEIMPGVEDLQVELGVRDPDQPEGPPRFVAADAPLAATATVVAVRIWLRVRSETHEAGFRDARTFDYANVGFTPEGADAGHRRVLVARTVALRNLP